MKYKYAGTTRRGQKVNGQLEAQDETEAKLKLRSMQIRPISLVAGAGGFEIKKLSEISLGPVVDIKGMVVFTRQFSSLIDSGVPIVQCLDILAQQEKRAQFKRILERVKSDIESGGGLAESLSKHPKVFSEFFVRIVEAGEISGTLDQAIKRVGLQLEKLGRLKAKVIGALVAPAITLAVALVVLVFLLVKVIPEIAKLYTESAAQLPEITLKVLALSKWVQDNWGYLLGGVLFIIFGIPAIYRITAVKKVCDPFILHVPLFGSLTKKSSIAKFTRTMSTLVSSGVPLLTAFEICIKLMGNYAIKDALGAAAASVQEGKSIASGLGSKKLFPPMVLHMVSIGEMTGRLDDLLGKVADIYDDEVDDAVAKLTDLLQPMMIIGIGGLVAVLLIAMYLPIFQLAAKVSG
jgi:type IV pilus assembly protein PilC